MKEVLDLSSANTLGGEVEVDHRLFSPRLRVELENLIRGSQPNLLILNGFTLDYALLVANLLNQNWSRSPKADDLYTAYPLDERWSIESIKSEIIARTLLAPYNRHYIIIANPDSINQSGYDKLLKTFEEPVSPTTFILLANYSSKLPNTILSRAQSTLDFKPEDEDFYYQNIGLKDSNLLREVQTLAGSNLTLGKLLIEQEEIRSLAKDVFAPERWLERSEIIGIIALEEDINRLASSWQKGVYTDEIKLTTPAQRMKARILLEIGLKVYMRNFQENLTSISSSLSGRYSQRVSEEDFRTLNNSLLRAERARKYNLYNVNLRNILLSLLLTI